MSFNKDKTHVWKLYIAWFFIKLHDILFPIPPLAAFVNQYNFEKSSVKKRTVQL